MRTRNDSPALLAQGGHVKSAELDNLRGVSGVMVSLRAAALVSAAKREFIWSLQGLSLKEGGFARLARELLQTFPERLGTPAMHEIRLVPGKQYPGRLVYEVEEELSGNGFYSGLPDDDLPHRKPKNGSELLAMCRDRALAAPPTERPYYEPSSMAKWRRQTISLEKFLVELCTNPALTFSLPGVEPAADKFEQYLYLERNPDLDESDSSAANLVYFRDIVGALVEYLDRRQKQIRGDFQLTAIGRKIWETLDYAQASRNMILLDGLEGRGKSEAVKAWCELHPGQARFVGLKGVTSKTTAFREIAAALGIPYAYTRTGPEMQSRIEDVLNRSKMMLVVDEAHFAFNQTRQMTARPELIDWIDTALCNRGVPVALVTTPQFISCMARAKNQVGWNFNQFRRRVKRWIKLPDQNTESDIAAVARKVFLNSSETVVKKVVGYALLSKRDLSAVGDVASEVRVMLGTDKLGGVTVEHVHRAITEFLIPSDAAFKSALVTAEAGQRKSRRQAPQLPPEPLEDSEPIAAAADLAPAPAPAALATPRRLAGRAVALDADPDADPDALAVRRGGFEPALTGP